MNGKKADLIIIDDLMTTATSELKTMALSFHRVARTVGAFRLAVIGYRIENRRGRNRLVRL